ncbi:IS1595 family transposase [Alicyclobacillus cycloheptanicus]
MIGTGRQRYFCKACGRTFSDLTGTPLSYTKKSAEMWDEMARCMREGKSLRATAEELNIAVSTAFAWRHKILASLREHTDEDSELDGIVEADETFFRRSYKGSHFKDKLNPDARKRDFEQRFGRKPRKHGKGAYNQGVHKRGRSKDQVPVLVLRDRTARTVSLVLERVDAQTLRQEMIPVLGTDVVLCTDALPAFKKVCKDAAIEHVALNAKAGVRSRGVYHIQNVNAYHGRLKDWMVRFKGVATKYLANYMTWFEYLDTTRAITSGVWERRFLAMACIDTKKIHRKMVYTSECAICHQPIRTTDEAATLICVSYETGERKPDRLCHTACYDALIAETHPSQAIS